MFLLSDNGLQIDVKFANHQRWSEMVIVSATVHVRGTKTGLCFQILRKQYKHGGVQRAVSELPN